MVYDTEDPTLIAQMNAEMKLIRDMVVVSELSFVASGAAKRSSSWDLESGKITRGRDFTMEIKLSSSRGG